MYPGTLEKSPEIFQLGLDMRLKILLTHHCFSFRYGEASTIRV